MKSILHIAPQLPPALDGVGDYCWNLWRHWPERETSWHFAVLQGAAAAQAAWPAVKVREFEPDAESLWTALERSGATTAVLHYVGYGFQPKGIPVWLPRALDDWRGHAGHPERRLVTMFHELYASSSPLRSPFWVKPWARRIIRQLVRRSDAWITSCTAYRERLIHEFEADPRRGSLVPIAANIPTAVEMDETRLWPLEFGRKLRVAVFGLPHTRLVALDRHAGLLAALVRANMVESVVMIGKSCSNRAYKRQLSGLQQRVGGAWRSECNLAANEVADVLAGCDLGLVANDPGTLTKSGVFAAMAVNGLVSIVSNRDSATVVASPFADCVLLNDEQPATFEALKNELAGINRMTARRRATLRVARTELCWSSVTAQWSTAFANMRAAAEQPAAKTVPSRPVLVAQGVRI